MITHVIKGGRASGKTLMLIQYSCTWRIPILVANRFKAEALKKQALNMGFKNLPEPYTVHEALCNGKLVGRREGILIDDADDVFREIFKVDIHAVTYTSPRPECDLDKLNEEARVLIEKPLIDKDLLNKLKVSKGE